MGNRRPGLRATRRHRRRRRREHRGGVDGQVAHVAAKAAAAERVGEAHARVVARRAVEPRRPQRRRGAHRVRQVRVEPHAYPSAAARRAATIAAVAAAADGQDYGVPLRAGEGNGAAVEGAAEALAAVVNVDLDGEG